MSRQAQLLEGAAGLHLSQPLNISFRFLHKSYHLELALKGEMKGRSRVGCGGGDAPYAAHAVGGAAGLFHRLNVATF